LDAKELNYLRQFFQRIASDKEQGVEQAVRGLIVRILLSPHFGLGATTRLRAGDTVRPLNDRALASRLSYFLWSSKPDAELLARPKRASCGMKQVLLAQTRRMLKDEKVSDFAREFFGQWLGYRSFLEQESVDRTVFKDFDDALKQAMFEEPTRLAALLIQQDRPVTELPRFRCNIRGQATGSTLRTSVCRQGRRMDAGHSVFALRSRRDLWAWRSF